MSPQENERETIFERQSRSPAYYVWWALTQGPHVSNHHMYAFNIHHFYVSIMPQ